MRATVNSERHAVPSRINALHLRVRIVFFILSPLRKFGDRGNESDRIEGESVLEQRQNPTPSPKGARSESGASITWQRSCSNARQRGVLLLHLKLSFVDVLRAREM